jgi:glycosyltransferase involved in cell wall biosynthesis
MNPRIKVCHFASVHTITDTRVLHLECTSLAKFYDVIFIGIGEKSSIINGVNIIAVPKPSSRLFRLLFTTWKVFFIALKQRAAIYHIHDAELIVFGVLLRILGKKVIYDVHENTYQDIMHKPWVPPLLKWLLGKGYLLLEWIAGKTMTTILVAAKPEYKQRFLLGDCTIIQNFANEKMLLPFRVNKRNELPENNLFYMGTIYDYYYNLTPVFEALAMLKQQGIVINFHCIGYKGNYIEKVYTTNLAFNEIKNQLHFYGFLEQSIGFELSKKCKVGLCLKNQPEEILVSHERKFFENLCIGLPVLTCESHIYKEPVTQHQIGITANLSNAASIASGLEQLFNPTTNLNAMSDRAIMLARQYFNWKSEEQKLLGLYRKLLAV